MVRKGFFRLNEDVGVNLKKVLRSVMSLKAVKHLEGTLFDTRDSLNEIEADLLYERTTFAHYVQAFEFPSTFAALVVGFSLLGVLRGERDGSTMDLILYLCRYFVKSLYLEIYKFKICKQSDCRYKASREHNDRVQKPVG